MKERERLGDPELIRAHGWHTCLLSSWVSDIPNSTALTVVPSVPLPAPHTPQLPSSHLFTGSSKLRAGFRSRTRAWVAACLHWVAIVTRKTLLTTITCISAHIPYSKTEVT